MITASTVKVSTMADDTLRLVLDIEPRHAQEAFALFGARGSPVVVARLTNEAAQEASQDKPKGGDLARLAAMWCRMPAFQNWVYDGEAVPTEDNARSYILDVCDIKSRAELDNDELAAEAFHRRIRLPFREWCKDSGVAL